MGIIVMRISSILVISDRFWLFIIFLFNHVSNFLVCSSWITRLTFWFSTNQMKQKLRIYNFRVSEFVAKTQFSHGSNGVTLDSVQNCRERFVWVLLLQKL